MVKITLQEMEKYLIDGYGFDHFMGGTGGNINRPIIICARDEIWIVHRNEIGSDAHKKLLKIQSEDAEEYTSTIIDY